MSWGSNAKMDLGVSINGGTPKSSILYSRISPQKKHPFMETPFGSNISTTQPWLTFPAWLGIFGAVQERRNVNQYSA
jgi:hypothetical protein